MSTFTYAGGAKAKLEAAQAKITEAVAALVTGDDWKRFLDQSARFHTYSANNVLLIMLQTKCNATRVAGYKKWQEFGRQVRKGENGIAILAPNAYRRTEVDETGNEHTISGIKGFRLTYVWDVAQTDGEPLAEELIRPSLLNGNDGWELFEQLSAQVNMLGYIIERGDCGGPNGYVDYVKRVVRIRADVDQLQATKTLAHELGHIVLGHDDGKYHECRGAREVEAESVAYLVLDAAGLASDGYTFAYVAGWAQGSVDAVRESATAVVKAAHQITEAW